MTSRGPQTVGKRLDKPLDLHQWSLMAGYKGKEVLIDSRTIPPYRTNQFILDLLYLDLISPKEIDICSSRLILKHWQYIL